VVSNQEQALDLLMTLTPDLIVVDMSLQKNNGLKLIQTIRNARPQIPLICLSMHEDLYYAEQCLKTGASGYIAKSESCDAIVLGVQKALRGEIYLSDTIRSQMLKQMGSGPAPWVNASDAILSNKEMLVFDSIGQGLNNRQIAQKLKLSIKTVEAHRYRIKKKLNLKNSIELIRFAIRARNEKAANGSA